MVTKAKKTGSDSAAGASGPHLSSTVRESAQQIWLAGLGAFAKAQEEGSKVFDSLVKEGMSIQRKTQSAAGEKFTEATSKMATMATDISSKASGQWDKLETIFEGRVSKALDKIGVPSYRDIDALEARINELERKLSRQSARPASGAAARARTATRPAAKRKPASKST